MHRIERLQSHLTNASENYTSVLRNTFQTQKTIPISWRTQQLTQLMLFLQEHETDLCAALTKDLGRSSFQSCSLEIKPLIKECQEYLRYLEEWLIPTKVDVPVLHFPSNGYTVPEPWGVVLIIGAWNFPLSVLLGPLIGAIAAGNCIVLKPSELAGNVAKVLSAWLPQYLDTSCIQVVEGGPEETTALLKEQFDYIFFTGSEMVGRIVYEAAAKHLTPVTLELGGKSPVVIDESANLEQAARRLIWAKVMNCGQICIAPDYVLVVDAVKEPFVLAIQKAYSQFFPDGVKACEDYPRIINERHTLRLLQFLEEDESIKGTVIAGGDVDPNTKFIAPTILFATKPEAKVMQEEIFGPLLPILPVASFEEAMAFINARPKPLAAYLFTTDQENVSRLVQATSSGAVVINDVVVHYGVGTLPFGGVGASGMGKYRGKHTFDTFSHTKPVLHKSARNIFDPDLRYPPYTDKKKWLTNVLM